MTSSTKQSVVTIVIVAFVSTLALPARTLAQTGQLAQAITASPVGQKRRLASVAEMKSRVEAAAAAKTLLPDRIARLRLRLAIVEAKTPAERHKLIRQLPVTIQVRPAPGERAGTIKTFIADGASRLEVFVPLEQSSSAGSDTPSSGPFAATEDCYDDEGTAECATDEEAEDFGIVIADVEAETDGYQADYDAAYAEHEYQCNVMLWCDTEPGDSFAPIGGPNAVMGCFDNCWTQAGDSLFQITGSIFSYFTSEAKLGAHWAARAAQSTVGRLTTRAVLGYTGFMYLSAAGAAYYTGALVYCVASKRRDAVELGLPRTFHVLGW